MAIKARKERIEKRAHRDRKSQGWRDLKNITPFLNRASADPGRLPRKLRSSRRAHKYRMPLRSLGKATVLLYMKFRPST
jgi:hypothetical protein